MFESRISRVLLLLGASIGLLGVGVWALDLRFVSIPDWMIRVAMLKLTFIASAGLLAGGALVGRHARQRSLTAPPPEYQVGEGAAEPPTDRQASLTAESVERRPSDRPR